VGGREKAALHPAPLHAVWEPARGRGAQGPGNGRPAWGGEGGAGQGREGRKRPEEAQTVNK